MAFRISENGPIFLIMGQTLCAGIIKKSQSRFTKMIFFSFLKMWKFGPFLKSRVYNTRDQKKLIKRNGKSKQRKQTVRDLFNIPKTLSVNSASSKKRCASLNWIDCVQCQAIPESDQKFGEKKRKSQTSRRRFDDGLPGCFWLKIERRTRCTYPFCPKTKGNALILTFLVILSFSGPKTS